MITRVAVVLLSLCLASACDRERGAGPVADGGPIEAKALDAGYADASQPDASQTDASLPDAGPVCDQCVPKCDNRSCGDDGCGGVCGVCHPNQTCVEHVGMCGWEDPNFCTQTQCGEGTFYGSCGYCPAGWSCSHDTGYGRAVCVPDAGDCTGIPAGGICINGTLVTCVNGAPRWEFCTLRLCSEQGGTASCQPVPCVPDCLGKTCGSDGCGGQCGQGCDSGESCDQGICAPTTCTNDSVRCEGQTLVRCAVGKLTLEPCLPKGQVCVADDCGPRCALALPTRPCPAGMPSTGHCEGGHLFYCRQDPQDPGAPSTLRVEHCAEGNHECVRNSPERFSCGYVTY